MPHRLALGAMNFGKRTPEAEARRIVDRALDAGVDWLDTANAYVDGESERIVGRALRGRRDRVRVATKVGFGRVGGKPEGLSRARILAAIDDSLKRLATDYVDVYYLHVPDRATSLEESVAAMGEIVKAGKARSWGVSNYASWQILEMMQIADGANLPRPTIAQQLYCLLHRQLDVEYFAFAKKYGLHTTIYNPLAGGLLTGRHTFDAAPERGSRFEGNALYRGRYWTKPMFDHVEALKGLAKEAGLTMVELAYAWVASRPGVDSILVGPGSLAHLEDALQSVEKSLDDELKKRIDVLYRSTLGTQSDYTR
jgi:aryl-alcohol dehydrogenase-like predicted oxidoreductase